MKRRTKRLLGSAIALILLAQLWPVERTNPVGSSDIQAPAEIKEILRAACYDCHSNETRWPWYGYVAPASWLLAHDVAEARDHFNLSEWDSVPVDERRGLLRKMWEEVDEGGMPLPIYRLVHPEARLSEEQKQALKDWVSSNTE